MKVLRIGLLTLILPLGVSCTSTAPVGIAGTASVSGQVSASATFQAARVYAKNLDKNMLYMVYTNKGAYRAINLLPGSYEFWVKKKGFETTPAKSVRLQVGDAVDLDFALSIAPVQAATLGHNSARFGGVVTADIPLVPYDELYPAGPGRDIAERTCMVCHGENFLPSKPMATPAWDAMIGLMMDPQMRAGPQLIEGNAVGTLNAEERQTLAEYLGEHFGAESERKALKIDVDIPIDEDALSTAMIIEYFLPEGRGAHDPAIDLEGNVWYSDGVKPTRISKLDPRTGKFTEYDLPDPDSYPEGLIVDSYGYVIWCEPGGGVIGRMDPKTGKMDRFAHGVPGGRAHTPVEDEDGDIWFSMIIGNRIGKWDRETEEITVWEVPTPNSFPYGIVVKDSRVWFAEFFGGKVGMFDEDSKTFTEYPTLVQPSTIRRVSIDSSGSTLWYGVYNQGKLGKIDIRTGEQTEYDLAPRAAPYDVWPDPMDKVWASDGVLGGVLIRFDPDTDEMTYYPVPRPTDMPKLDISREGAVWYTTRSNPEVALGVLWPDVNKMTGYAANQRVKFTR
jgi:virginiamycin B lyase